MGRPPIGEEKRKQNAQDYQKSLFRSTYAIKKELEPGLQQAIAASGAASVSDLLARLAAEPEKAGAALKPVFETMPARVTFKDLVEEMKSGDLSPEEIAAAIAAAKLAKTGAHHTTAA